MVTGLDKKTELIGYSLPKKMPAMLPRLATLVSGALHLYCLYFCTDAKTCSWDQSTHERASSAQDAQT